MRVRCIAELPTEEQARTLGNLYRHGKQVFHIAVGCEYLVYAVTFMDGAPWIELKEDFGYLHRAPLCLFEILDGRVSRYWEARWRNQDLCFWPTSFYREYYFDDLIEGSPDVLEDFRQVSFNGIRIQVELRRCFDKFRRRLSDLVPSQGKHAS